MDHVETIRWWLSKRRAQLVRLRLEAVTPEAKNRLRLREEEIERVDKFIRTIPVTAATASAPATGSPR